MGSLQAAFPVALLAPEKMRCDVLKRLSMSAPGFQPLSGAVTLLHWAQKTLR